MIRHKWFVFQGCFQAGLYWQGIVHDLSKFSPAEFTAYAWKFLASHDQRQQRGKENIERAFQYAWLHHQHKNKHHWNYWVADQHQQKALPIPDNYLMEMICDWRAMSRQFGNTAAEFYEANKGRMVLHPETRRKVELMLADMS